MGENDKVIRFLVINGSSEQSQCKLGVIIQTPCFEV